MSAKNAAPPAPTAARPAMGKTAFALSLARNAAVDFQKGVAIFSLEMSSLQLVTRLISAESELSSEKLRSGNLRNDEVEQIHAKIGGLTEAPIFIDRNCYRKSVSRFSRWSFYLPVIRYIVYEVFVTGRYGT